MRTISVEKLKPADYNPRVALRPGDPEYDRLKASIDDLGVIDPLVWNESTGRLVGGHQRLQVCIDSGMKEVPVFVVHLSEQKEKQANLALNKIAGRWDEDKLAGLLDSLDPAVVKLAGFDPIGLREADPVEDTETDFFDREELDYDSHEDDNDEYNNFVDKFKAKKTTDDCYTPANVYDAVADYVVQRYGVDRAAFVRPFYPGGDYRSQRYPDGCVVVDNPPFSIESEILDFYIERGIRFFLFCPTLTGMQALRGDRRGKLCFMLTGAKMTFENGANINTSFFTNMETDSAVRIDHDLWKMVNDANEANERAAHDHHPKYRYPMAVITGKDYKLAQFGQRLSIPWAECEFIRELDAQKDSGAAVFGGGLLISERLAAERSEAEKRAEKMIEVSMAEDSPNVFAWTLSDREREIVRRLGGGGEA